MVCRALGLAISLAGFATLSVAQIPPMNPNGPYPGAPGQTKWNMSMRNNSSISGSVFDAGNRPVGQVRVELRDGRTGNVVSAAYTGVGGTFEFSQIPQGTYSLVASSGVQQVEE